MPPQILERLQRWYLSNCNCLWEETYGVRIEKLDNPGWSVDIDLIGKRLAGAAFEKVDVERVRDRDWFLCEVVGRVCQGRGGAANLGEILACFLDWERSAAGK